MNSPARPPMNTAETPRTDAAEAEDRKHCESCKKFDWPLFSLAQGAGYSLARDLEKQLRKAEAHIAHQDKVINELTNRVLELDGD